MTAYRADPFTISRQQAERDAQAARRPRAPGRPHLLLADLKVPECLIHVPISRLIGYAAAEFGLVKGEIIGGAREVRYQRARNAIVWVASVKLRRSDPEIGRDFGGRDRTTIQSQTNRAKMLRESDPDFVDMCERLLARLLEQDR